MKIDKMYIKYKAAGSQLAKHSKIRNRRKQLASLCSTTTTTTFNLKNTFNVSKLVTPAGRLFVLLLQSHKA